MLYGNRSIFIAHHHFTNKMDKQDKIFHIADKITTFNFGEIWTVEGQTLTNLTKREIAEEMFFKGIAYILDHLKTLEEIDLDQIKIKLEKKN